MAAIELATEPQDPLAEWLEASLQDTAGRDPLGLNTITLDRILPQLLPGILQLSERARYFSIYAWMLWIFAERRRPATREELDKFIRRREYELCLAMKLCPHCDAAKAIGSNNAGPHIEAGDDPLGRGLSIESSKGGFGLYYRSPLVDLGAVAPIGTPLGEEAAPIPIELLRAEDGRAISLALSFNEAIEGTAYFESYERANDPIPREVLEGLAEHICLCRLPLLSEERNAIRSLIFEPASEEPAVVAACEARRAAFALFLSLCDANGDVAFDTREFWRGLIARFEAKPARDDRSGATVAAWAALAMKECAQDALCSVWTDFCRSGIEHQGLDGMDRDELSAMIRDRAGAAGVAIAATQVSFVADEPALVVRDRLVAAARDMDWESVRAWTADADTAATGLAALLVLADRVPDPDAVHPLWREIAMRHSEHQDGLLGIVALLRRRLDLEPTFVELLDWVIRRFIIGPHEVIAYSKLPKATFRFSWEETGRLRFFTPGGGGLGRFNPSDGRRGAMASLTEDLGYWLYNQEAGTAQLTADGREFVAEVLG